MGVNSVGVKTAAPRAGRFRRFLFSPRPNSPAARTTVRARRPVAHVGAAALAVDERREACIEVGVCAEGKGEDF
jgi:hypothetical protein